MMNVDGLNLWRKPVNGCWPNGFCNGFQDTYSRSRTFNVIECPDINVTPSYLEFEI